MVKNIMLLGSTVSFILIMNTRRMLKQKKMETMTDLRPRKNNKMLNHSATKLVFEEMEEDERLSLDI
jgi:hypothetical protein